MDGLAEVMAEDIARGNRWEPALDCYRFSPLSEDLDLAKLEAEARAHFRMRAAERALDEEDGRMPRKTNKPRKRTWQGMKEYKKRWNQKINEEIRKKRAEVAARHEALGW
jgi:hypothetical protein